MQSLNPIAGNYYRDLPDDFYGNSVPTPTAAPAMLQLNQPLLDGMGIDAGWFQSEAGLAALSGNGGYEVDPVALAYVGH